MRFFHPWQRHNRNSMESLEGFFSAFRANIVGQEVCFDTPFGRRRLLYADWTASGRAYRPIEQYLQEELLPFFGNTHTETTITGRRMTEAYEEAKRGIKAHVHAGEDDVLMFCGSGMTSAVNKLQRILGLRVPERLCDYVSGLEIVEERRPLVLVTQMEHHSNHVSWLETIATVEVIGQDAEGGVDLGDLRRLLERYRGRKVKIAAVTAGSNVTGVMTPYHAIARVMHAHGGLCFVDFAAAAPYVGMDMHPGGGLCGGGGSGSGADATAGDDLDAIYFSGHKFLGGPGTPGVLIFNRALYRNLVPDQPGGGTLLYSNPWHGRDYVDDIEAREDGGTPPVLQAIKLGLCVRLKEEMGVARMMEREAEMVGRLLDRLAAVRGVAVLAGNRRERLGVISFLLEGAHHDDVVKTLNDRFGIQARGGCSCAGTYGHYLLGIDKARSGEIWDALRRGDWRRKPGWVRLSVHPTMTDEEIGFIADAVEEIAGAVVVD
jgi:selenocysteine lyase/cysteine desulfurase